MASFQDLIGKTIVKIERSKNNFVYHTDKREVFFIQIFAPYCDYFDVSIDTEEEYNSKQYYDYKYKEDYEDEDGDTLRIDDENWFKFKYKNNLDEWRVTTERQSYKIYK